MSAATREPARAAEVARHYLRLLGSNRTALAFGLTVGLALLCSMATRGFEGIAATLWLMLFYPLLQWGPADHRGGLDEAMPLGQVRHDLVRVACGAAWAAAALAASIALVALLFYTGYHARPGTGFGWYPPVLLGFGLGFYLFGAAAWLRGDTSGLPAQGVYVLGILPFVLLGGRWHRLERLLSLREAPAPGEAWALIGAAMLWLGAGAAAAWLSASAARWLPRLQARRARAAVREGMPGAGGALPLPGVRPAATDAPRRPARLHRVLWREIVLLAPKLGSAALLMAVLVMLPTGTDGERWTRLDSLGFYITGLLPVWWPVAVWDLGRRPSRRRVEPLPVGALTQRLVRLAAGALWLEVILLLLLAAPAVGAGAWIPLLDPGNALSWVGLMTGALLLYLLASPPVLLGTEHRLALYLGWLVFLLPVLPLVHSTLPHARFSLGSALSAVARKTGPWAEATVLWAAVFTAAAVVAAAWGVANERSVSSRLG